MSETVPAGRWRAGLRWRRCRWAGQKCALHSRPLTRAELAPCKCNRQACAQDTSCAQPLCRPPAQVLQGVVCSSPPPRAHRRESPDVRLLVSGLLDGDDEVLAHGGEDSDEHILLTLELRLNLIAKRVVGVERQLEVILLRAVLQKQRREAVFVGVDDLILHAGHDGRRQVVRRGHEVLHLLAGEDVLGDEVALGVAVLAGL
mmetsp:Transcript_29434/g.73932  ORF Transcript_29434/g.73932 Transcript_29434/m.73932 type:complete len:202 (+) Transcript_29434:69-674(+)